MTSRSTTDAWASSLAHEPLGYCCGQWLPQTQLGLGIDDAGFRHGVVAVERLRTYRGTIFAIDAHLSRWQNTTGQLMIASLPPPEATASLMRELLERNDTLVRAMGDVGITMFATPGTASGEPTFGLHLNDLDHERIAMHRRSGQPLVVTTVAQPSPQCWPRTIKVRSRIHYYMADAAACRVNPRAVGVLLDEDGTITETSIANIAIVRRGRINSPPPQRVLGGITQSVIETIADKAAIDWEKKPIAIAELKAADEVLMMGTNGGIWFANQVNEEPIGGGKPGSVYQRLCEQFDKLVGQA